MVLSPISAEGGGDMGGVMVNTVDRTEQRHHLDLDGELYMEERMQYRLRWETLSWVVNHLTSSAV